MKKIINYTFVLLLCSLFTQCKQYLDTSSPSNTDDEFVTSTTAETFKTLSWCYANYRQNCAVSLYSWNDPIGSDAEMYPEATSTNNLNAIMQSEAMTVDAMRDPFNNLYSTLARATKVAKVIAEKAQYKAAVASGSASDWTQLYGEAITLRAFCYFNLVKYYGDVPYGYENTYVDNYTLTSRFDIYDELIASLKAVEPLMYKIGEGGITAERLSRTFANALIGQIALYSGGYQTIRTDMPDLYGKVQFTAKGKEDRGCKYARRVDYLDYYKIAEQYLQAAIDTKGSVYLITSDDRTVTKNPFQRHFQYMHNLQVSPESLFEIGNIQGGQSGQTTTSDHPYNFGRPSNGGSSNAAPCKVFAAVRAIPTFYYGEYEADDKRRDVSITVTGSTGDGNESMLNFKPGSKLDGGISLNKWDDNRMNPPYSASQRQSGINYPVLRMADVILLLAEAKAELGKSDAITLVNQIRERAFGNSAHNIAGLSGDALKEAILQERKLELFGEGSRRWDLIRAGKFSEKAVAVRNEMKAMIAGLRSQGYYRFANGNIISNYILVKSVKLDNPLTYDCTDVTNPALFPGWRGQYNWSTSAVASKVKGTNHNVAIKGLFTYINPTSTEATALKADGYTVTNWAVDIMNNETSYDRNILSGIKSSDDPPRYFYPIPFETVSKSNGKIKNGYGLPQQ
ncbi:RagB/SusD family nutrient uptake outer membrane protein [Filimonas effusa]|uniref:RagB/SusD family nutrient uptake outer membrane protein n=1 Tax=Filimonas effusa TaxID=2508721 RepID=A0A4Q1DC23_9BACT|nr:RagB/SusD family nutrient uptake outer membrane protein [Filimonas effusa]RXK86079.1 RagB/SusD family nutrient uptake outer membrane protein [Filimonas effusa]